MPKVPKANVTAYKGGKPTVISNGWGQKPSYTSPAWAGVAKPPSTFSLVGQPVVSPGLIAAANIQPGGATAPGLPPTPPAAKPTGQGAWSPAISGLYEQTRANIAANLKGKLGSLEQQENAGANEFGFNVKYRPEVGPAGQRTVESVEVDPSNPFSRAAALQRSYDQAKRGATNSYASRGQLYAGSLQNAQNENAYGFQKGDDGLRKAFAAFMLGKSGERQAAAAGASAEEVAAFGAALQQQLSATPEDPGVAPPAAAAAAPTPAPAAVVDPKTATAVAVAKALAAAQAQQQSQANANAAARKKPKRKKAS